MKGEEGDRIGERQPEDTTLSGKDSPPLHKDEENSPQLLDLLKIDLRHFKRGSRRKSGGD